MLTREETEMAVAMNLEVTHQVDNNVNKMAQGAETSLTFVHMSTDRFVLKQLRTSLNVGHSSMPPPSIFDAET
jgi:hypothetical protein